VNTHGAAPPPGSPPGAQRRLETDEQRYRALDDFVLGLGKDYIDRNIHMIHPFMMQQFGVGPMDDWFVQRVGAGRRRSAQEMLRTAMNARGTNIGRSTVNVQSPAWVRYFPGLAPVDWLARQLGLGGLGE
jgi:hypothetical protein